MADYVTSATSLAIFKQTAGLPREVEEEEEAEEGEDLVVGEGEEDPHDPPITILKQIMPLLTGMTWNAPDMAGVVKQLSSTGKM